MNDYFIEIHVAAICLRKNESNLEVLCAKRNENRRRLPGLWECGGGRVRFEDNGSVETALKRQMKEEFNINVNPISYIGEYQINAPDLPQKNIFGIKFLCSLNNLELENITIDQNEHSEWKWQNIEKLDELNFIEGIPEDIKKASEIFN